MGITAAGDSLTSMGIRDSPFNLAQMKNSQCGRHRESDGMSSGGNGMWEHPREKMQRSW